MAIYSIEEIQRHARACTLHYSSAYEACPVPLDTPAGKVFTEAFLAERARQEEVIREEPIQQAAAAGIKAHLESVGAV